MNPEQLEQIRRGNGFIAALDQSGGSTPKALKLYGIGQDRYANEAEMFDLVHRMRVRIATSPVFSGERIIGAILFEGTMDREIEGRGAADYLWSVKRVVPFLKIDKGLEPEADGVQLMKPMPALDRLLERARAKGIFGTKERSVIKQANANGIAAVVRQQFDVARQVLAAGLVPIVEPEVDIHAPGKPQAEKLLRAALVEQLDRLPSDQQVMLKLTLPDEDDYYLALVEHARVLKVVALSGGYSRGEANDKLARHRGVVASFSRALTEGLRDDQTDDAFHAMLDAAVQSIRDASVVKRPKHAP